MNRMNRTNRLHIHTLTAVFDGAGLRLDTPPDLALVPGQRYLLALQTDPLPAGRLALGDPADPSPPPAWANAHTHRLYGCPDAE